MPVRFNAQVGDNGEVKLDFYAFRITSTTCFVRDHWHNNSVTISKFTLHGVAKGGLRFETDCLYFSSLGERWSGIHNRHWSKPSGDARKALYTRTLETPAEHTVLKLYLKGFECFPSLYAECPLGKVKVAGETKLSEVEKLSGWIVIEAYTLPVDAMHWRADAEKLIEHCRRILSLASSTMLRAPILQFQNRERCEIEVLSQTRQYPPRMRVFHKLNLQPVLDAVRRHDKLPP